MQQLNIFQWADKFLKGICSNHSGKMKGMWSFSTSCKDNKYCSAYSKDPTTICSQCYAQAQLEYQHTTDNKCRRNGEFIKNHLYSEHEMPKILFPFFRWEAFGDLETIIQAANYLNISASNPDVQFGWFTKNPFLIQLAIDTYDIEKPENLTIIGSSRHVNVIDHWLEKYDFIDHVFTVFSKDFVKENGIVISCGAKSCITCLQCYDKSKNAPFYINELLKPHNKKEKKGGRK